MIKTYNNDVRNVIKLFIPFAVIITLLCGLIYFVTQQNYRLSANDPQIQFAQDITSSLDRGNSPSSIIPPARVDMSKSLAVFFMIFGNDKKLLLSTGEISGKIPDVPSGAFDTTAKKQETRFTWQPKQGVRNAVVMEKYKGGYVLVGKSLHEIEKREDALGVQVALGWAVTLFAVFFSLIFLFGKKK